MLFHFNAYGLGYTYELIFMCITYKLYCMNEDQIKTMASIFHMLSNENWLQILYLCQKEAISVGDLADKLQLSQSLVSHHLKHLRDTNLLQAKRYGKNVVYQIKDERVRCILDDMLNHVVVSLKKGKNQR